jgi:hypothetical protein
MWWGVRTVRRTVPSVAVERDRTDTGTSVPVLAFGYARG